MSDIPGDGQALHTLREDGLVTSPEAAEQLHTCLKQFLSSVVAEQRGEEVVLHLRGDIGSTVTAAVAVDALGADHVSGLIMPSQITDEAAARHAEAVGNMLGVDWQRLQLRPLISSFQRIVGENGEPADDIVALRGLGERFRTACLQYVASVTDALVLGSTDRTTRLIHRDARHSEKDVDIAVLADLYRTEIRALARHLQVPSEILNASRDSSSDGFSRDIDAADVDPETVDRILYRSGDRAESDAAIATAVGVDREVVREVRGWTAETRDVWFTPLTLSGSDGRR
jgi:NAD+ synthase